MAQILKKKFEKRPNFAKYLIFDPKTGKKTLFLGGGVKRGWGLIRGFTVFYPI